MPKRERKDITDPILVPSGREVLSGVVAGITFSVKVVGDVKLRWKGEYYTDPTDFPEEVLKYIRSQRNIFVPDTPNEDFEILENNWYELSVDCAGAHLYDEVVEMDLRELTVREARDFIFEQAAPYVATLGSRRRYDLVTWPKSQLFIDRTDCHPVDPETGAEEDEDYDGAYMVPRAAGEYVLACWPEAQRYQGREGVLEDYNGRTFVPLKYIF